MRHLPWLLLNLCALLAAPCYAAASVEDAVAVQARYEAAAGTPGLGRLKLDLRDQTTRQPLDYSAPRLAAWLQRSPRTLADAEVSCVDKVRALASQGVGRRAAVDFNSYGLVSVNTDRTVAFINPYAVLNNAKLEALTPLPGDATAVLHHTRAHELWIALRDSDAVAVIDTDTHQIKRTLRFAAGTRPQAMAMSGESVWLGFAGRSQWLRFDGSEHALPDQKVEAAAVSELVSSEDGRWMAGLHARGVQMLDVKSGKIEALALPSAPLAAAWSALSRRAWVSTADGKLYPLDPGEPLHEGPAAAALSLPAPASRLLIADAGRLLFATLPTRGEVAVIDVATRRVLQTVAVVPQATGMTQSASYVYAYNPSDGQASLLSLADAREGRARPVAIMIGSPANPSSAQAGLTAQAPAASLHERVAAAPDGAGVLAAGANDGYIYQYAEGMMAPIGSYSNYRRQPLALRVVARGLERRGAGHYEATFRHERGGSYELVLSGVQPRFARCVKLTLPEVPEGRKEVLASPPSVKLLEARPSADGHALQVRVSLQDARTHAPLSRVSDLSLMGFDRHSGWQARAPLVERAQGQYEGSLAHGGKVSRIDLLVSSPSQDLAYGEGLIGRSVEARK